MSKILLFGTGNYSLLMKKYVEKFTDDTIVGFVCHRQYRDTEELVSLPVFAMDEVKECCPPDDVLILPTIGYMKMNTLRSQVVGELKSMGYGFASFIHPSAVWYGDAMGEGNIIMEKALFCLGSKIGSFNIFYNDSSVGHDVTFGDYNFTCGGTVLAGYVNVGNHCFLGVNSTFKNNIDIADYSFIGAGAYVNQSTSENSVTIPAKSITVRSMNSMDIEI